MSSWRLRLELNPTLQPSAVFSQSKWNSQTKTIQLLRFTPKTWLAQGVNKSGAHQLFLDTQRQESIELLTSTTTWWSRVRQWIEWSMIRCSYRSNSRCLRSQSLFKLSWSGTSKTASWSLIQYLTWGLLTQVSKILISILAASSSKTILHSLMELAQASWVRLLLISLQGGQLQLWITMPCTALSKFKVRTSLSASIGGLMTQKGTSNR